MEILNRDQVPVEMTWDLRDLVSDKGEVDKKLEAIEAGADAFQKAYEGKLGDKKTVMVALGDYMDLVEKSNQLSTYGYLSQAQDLTNTDMASLSAKISSRLIQALAKSSFFQPEIAALSKELLRELEEEADFADYVANILRTKDHLLSVESEKLIAAFSDSFFGPHEIYEQIKLVDMDFEDIEVDGKSIPLSYNIFEGVMESETDTQIRRKAFDEFHQVLEKYKHGTAACYNNQLKQERTEGQLRGYADTTEYLLSSQNVERELYDRQIDLIMEELAPHMRKYAGLIKKEYGLEEMTYADLKLSLAPDFSKKITVDEAKAYILEGLEVLGPEYSELIKRAFDERWIDFANNKGKSTGAFCASPYGAHPYILISWTSLMAEVLVLAHELGHAGHFYLNSKHQNILNNRCSLYFVEAPSTANEIIMEMFLLDKAESKEERKWVLAQIIARTYYHNFVTHFMEAAYQRDVYKIIDQCGSVHADLLSEIFMDNLKKFWGNSVSFPKGSELTWMRQPHYYMGLYPYTYSAGLTIGTQVSKNILEQGEPAAKKWLDTLTSSGSKSPVDLAQMAGVDVRTDQPLRDTIAFIGEVIDELEELS